MTAAFSHCHACGKPYERLEVPRSCSYCDAKFWFNPSPVAVAIQPVFRSTPSGGELGLVCGRRAIEPHEGEWALICGFVNPGESLETGVLRELEEETLLVDRGPPKFLASLPDPILNLILSAFVLPTISLEYFHHYASPDRENHELGVRWPDSTDRNFCFPLHEEFMRLWIESLPS